MSITKITDPAAVPAAVADYTAQNTHSERLLGDIHGPFPIDGSNIKKGSLFNIGGDMFYADSDTTITGTPSDYVKLVLSGSTATPSFVASLTGVTWNDAYNGYYNVGGDLHVFDELQAYLNGDLTTVFTPKGRLAKNNKVITSNVELRTKVIDIGAWNMDAVANLGFLHGIADFKKILSVTGSIRDDLDSSRYQLGDADSGGDMDVWVLDWNITTINLWRRTGGKFDATAFDDTGFSRGKVVIVYEV